MWSGWKCEHVVRVDDPPQSFCPATSCDLPFHSAEPLHPSWAHFLISDTHAFTVPPASENLPCVGHCSNPDESRPLVRSPALHRPGSWSISLIPTVGKETQKAQKSKVILANSTLRPGFQGVEGVRERGPGWLDQRVPGRIVSHETVG